MFFEMRFDLGTLDSGERSFPFGLLVLSVPNNHDNYILFLAYLLSPAFDLNVEDTIGESCSYTMMSTILKVDIT